MDAELSRLKARLNALEAVVLGARKPPESGTVTVTGSAALTSAHIFVGNATNIATDVAMSGDVTINNSGVTAIGANKVTFAQMQAITDGKILGASGGTAVEELTIGTGLNLASNTLTATGGGTGGVGALYPTFTAPVDGDFAWINQGGASTTVNANGGIFLRAPAGSGVNVRVRKKAAPGATPYTITIAMFPAVLKVNFQYAGIIFRQSSDGKLINYQVEGDSGNTKFAVAKYNSATSFSASTDILSLGSSPALVWLRVLDNGTNRIFSYSTDGYNFVQLHSETRTTFLTADEVGFAAATETASFDAGMTLMSYATT